MIPFRVVGEKHQPHAEEGAHVYSSFTWQLLTTLRGSHVWVTKAAVDFVSGGL